MPSSPVAWRRHPHDLHGADPRVLRGVGGTRRRVRSVGLGAAGACGGAPVALVRVSDRVLSFHPGRSPLADLRCGGMVGGAPKRGPGTSGYLGARLAPLHAVPPRDSAQGRRRLHDGPRYHRIRPGPRPIARPRLGHGDSAHDLGRGGVTWPPRRERGPPPVPVRTIQSPCAGPRPRGGRRRLVLVCTRRLASRPWASLWPALVLSMRLFLGFSYRLTPADLGTEGHHHKALVL